MHKCCCAQCMADGPLHMEVVLGVLGCPNLPSAVLGDNASTDAAEHAGEPGIGCLFAAVRGGGAFVGPLSGARLFALITGMCAKAVYS